MDKTNVAMSKVESLVCVFYDYTFTFDNKGYGSTMVVMLLIFIMIITVILQRAEKKFVFYN